jgi:alkanesulfonate monooxygenase SsuD/methylene tetrahydromethanopterin reductase-like flavin-dependent oxidoreductase (luciferase family)
MTPAAIGRAGRIGDGWVALQHVDEIDLHAIDAGVAAIAAESARAGRVAPSRVVMRVAGPTPSVAERLAGLQEVGVTDVVVDVNWGQGGPRQTVEMLQG